MSNLKNNLMTSLILGIMISSLVLIAPLTGNSQPTESVSFLQTTDCPDKVVTSVSPTSVSPINGDASTPQQLDIVVSNAAYFDESGGEVAFLAVDVFAVDSEDASNVIEAPNRQLSVVCCPTGTGFIPMLFRATFNFGSANACKTFKFYVTTRCFGTDTWGESEPSGSFTLNCPFAALTTKVRIDVGDGSFDLQGTFILAQSSNGIDPLTEDLTLQLGSFSTIIPAGSFAETRNGRFKFAGVIAGVSLDMEIRPLRGGGFELKAYGSNANLDELVNPLPVKLTIGNDSGSSTVTAKIQ